LNRAVCLRRLGQLTTARELIEQIISDTGLLGDFDLQGRALIELCGLLRYQGHYEKAQETLEHIHSTQQNQRDIALEYAQIAFESGDLQAASTILDQYQQPAMARWLALQSEISLEVGELSRSKQYIKDAIACLDEEDYFSLGRLQSIRARVCCAQGESSRAIQTFELALTLLERGEDRFGLARCKTNWAAFLIELKQDADLAQRLLYEAEETQVLLKDAVGLLTTRHNLDILDQGII